MLIEFSLLTTTLLNIGAWTAIQLGLALIFLRQPIAHFNPEHSLARERAWERGGKTYERWLGIKRWKDHLPDAAGWWGGGFRKAHLQANSRDYFDRFRRETWRGEVVHWLALLAVPLFAIWNPWWGVLVNAAAAIGLNIPCLLALRYNRIRLRRLLARPGRRGSN